MKITMTKTAFAALLVVCTSAVLAQTQPMEMPVQMPAPAIPAGDMGRVISTTPVLQQFAVPKQVCSTQQVAVQQPKSGAGGLMGAIAGGAIGNNVGGGNGRALATMIGLIGGAAMGENIEGAPAAQIQNVQNCTTQTTYENRTVGYNVVYEFAGRQYSVQMPQAPGQFIPLQVTPVGAATTQAPVQQPIYQQPTYQQPIYQQVPQQVVAPQPIIYAPAPVIVSAPYPYAYPRISLGFGFGGGYRRGHAHGHWH
jgi:uncharacterized protein YcfJ